MPVKINIIELNHVRILLLALVCAVLTACGFWRSPSPAAPLPAEDYEYLIGPGDILNIFVWRNPDVSAEEVPVRPDGKISTPLVEELVASGKTAKQLAKEIEDALATYIQDPLVTVTVVSFVGGYEEQVRVVGQAVTPAALPYRKNMSLLDVVISVGGLTEFADGNRSKLIRKVGNTQRELAVRLEDLVEDGDMTANIQMYPGDVLIIPEAWF